MSRDVKLSVKDLTVSFKTTQGLVRAVRGVSFDLYEGETLAVVGESGSGKSVSSRAIMGILAGNGMIDKGQIIYEGEDLTQVDEEHFHEIRGNRIGMIFQDPMSSLNPIMRIGQQITEGMLLNGKHLENKMKAMYQTERALVNSLKRQIQQVKENFKNEKFKVRIGESDVDLDKLKAEGKAKIAEYKAQLPQAKKDLAAARKVAKAAINKEWKEEQARMKPLIAAASSKEEKDQLKEQLRRYKKVTKAEARERAIEVMTEVGIPEPEKRFSQYPFQFSGGMRQRIVIAIALTASPELLICDEPTTALDVTIQAQILELINDLRKERNLSVIFITHDLGVVANMADRIAVMYAGKVVEIGTAEDVFYDPRHPYTWALLSSMPDLDSKERLTAIPGTPPNMLFPPKGDAFAERNKYAMKIDFEEQPPMFSVSDTHSAATWLLHKDAPKIEMPDVIKHRIERMLQASEGGEQ